MTNGAIANTGNSRYLRSVSNFLTLYPNYEAFAAAFIAGTLPIDLNGINASGWTVVGDALNKANLLSDTTAALYGLGSTAVPNDVLAALGGTPIKIAKGGTGGITGTAGLYNLIGALSAITPVSADKFPFLDSSGSTSGYVTLTNLLTALAGLGAARVASGSYTGTGTYGSSNPSSLTFNFTPKLVFITASDGASWLLLMSPVTASRNNLGSSANTTTWSGTTVSRYSAASASDQFNISGYTYYYVAIG